MLTLFLPIMLLLTHLGTNYFLSRYAIGSALGVAILLGILGAYASARWPDVNRFISLMIVYSVTSGSLTLWSWATAKPRNDHGASLFATIPGSEPIVMASALEFVPSGGMQTRPRAAGCITCRIWGPRRQYRGSSRNTRSILTGTRRRCRWTTTTRSSGSTKSFESIRLDRPIWNGSSRVYGGRDGTSINRLKQARQALSRNRASCKPAKKT